MKKNLCFIFLLLLWCLNGCNTSSDKQDTQNQSNTTDSVSSQTTSDKPKIKMPTLTEANVKEYLMAYGEQNPEKNILITTNLGNIKIRLYEETPLHRANFVYLAKKGFFNGTVFYRILKKFMVQGGAGDFPERKEIKLKLGTYHVPAEMQIDKFFHKKGALAMAKKPGEAPEVGSSPYDFFIVQGEILSVGQIKTIEAQNKKPMSATQKQAYTTIGGVPSLDGVHTVFGEVTEGLEVIDKIAAVKANANGYPEQMISLRIKVE